MSRESEMIHTVLVTVPSERRREAMTAIEFMDPTPVGVGLFKLDKAGETWEVGAYFDRDPSGQTLSIMMLAFGQDAVAVGQMTHADWSRKLQEQMIPAQSGRFTVHGPFDAGNAPPASIRICMKAVMAFGVGHHPTTRGILVAMSRLAKRGLAPRSVLDLGVGTGALSIGAARLWKARCIATDIDPAAIEAVNENGRASRAGTGIRAIETAHAMSPVVTALAPYDLIVANIRPTPLRGLAPEIARVSAPGTRIIVSGLRESERKPVEQVFAGWGMVVRERLKMSEWRVLLLDRVAKFPGRAS